ncbi:HIT family protein [Halococcus thailandensis]|uniref:Histidine triad protein n=1 Tax=Halococcus thailandensis JCM 13552 TaxID=1227457 RepID=M0N6E0_9EURY|nr:HIT family protein [Halococcus thailandensis]EMA53103.1 histidine triad protein [Halococcus thailandensis JCM 13552]
MSNDCPFCGIVAGEIPGRIVFESDDVTAFLDANPLAPGHTLVVPNDHHERLTDLSEELAREVFAALHRLTPAVEAAADADGSNVAFNNGPAAGQEVPHLHGHIIPRFDDDGGAPIHVVAGDRPDLSEDDLDAIAEEIRDAR